MSQTYGDLARVRYPRLLAALERTAGLAAADAVEVVVGYQAFGITDECATPGVARFGGEHAAIRYAIRHRHAATGNHHGSEHRTS